MSHLPRHGGCRHPPLLSHHARVQRRESTREICYFEGEIPQEEGFQGRVCHFKREPGQRATREGLGRTSELARAEHVLVQRAVPTLPQHREDSRANIRPGTGPMSGRPQDSGRAPRRACPKNTGSLGGWSARVDTSRQAPRGDRSCFQSEHGAGRGGGERIEPQRRTSRNPPRFRGRCTAAACAAPGPAAGLPARACHESATHPGTA